GPLGYPGSPCSASICALSPAACSEMTRATSGGQNAAADSRRFSAAAAQMAATWPRAGRCPGSLDRHASTSPRMSPSTRERSGCAWTTRYSTDAEETFGPPLNGDDPVAAYTSTLPSENTSLAGPASLPSTCSGDMKLGVPMIDPVAVSRVLESL